MSLPTIIEMLESGVHFGHQKSKWHPKMQPFIFTARHNIHIINVEKTLDQLKEAGDFVKSVAAAGGTVLFVATKKQAVTIVKESALACGMPYINDRWLGGLFTNWGTVNKVIAHYNDLRHKKGSGEFEKYTKKEQLEFEREIINLSYYVDGISDMKKLPDAMIILDTRKEKTALREAQRKNVPVVAVCDTNTNPTGIDYVIPANDDASKSLRLLCNYLVECINEGKTAQASQIAADAAK